VIVGEKDGSNGMMQGGTEGLAYGRAVWVEKLAE